MKTQKLKCAKIFCCFLLSMILFTCQAYAGATYTYYPSGRIESVTYSPAENGVVYEEYADEELYGWGYNWVRHTAGYSSRILRRVLANPDPLKNNAVAFVYEYPVETMKADLNGDGKDDMVAQYGTDVYTVIDGTMKHIINVSPNKITKAQFDASGKEYLIIEWDTAFYTYNLDGSGNGVWNYLRGSSPDTMFLVDLNGDGKDDMVAQYGTDVYTVIDGTMKHMINVSPNKITKAQFDASGKEYLIIEWDTAFYTYNLDGSGNGVWNYLRGSSPDTMFLVDLNGDGKDDMVAQYGTDVYTVIDGTMKHIINVSPNKITKAQYDGSGKEYLIIEWDTAFYTYNLDGSGNGVWNYLRGSSPDTMFLVDLNGDGKDDMVAQYGTDVYTVIDGTMKHIINVSPNKITKAQFDASGKEYLIIEWDTAFYTYNLDGSGNGVWNYLRGSSPDTMFLVDLNGDGKDDMVAQYGTDVYTVIDGTMKHIINVSPNKITKAQFDASGKEYLIIEWDTAFYTYNLDGSGNGVWNYLRGSSPDTMFLVDLNGDGKDDMVAQYGTDVYTVIDGTMKHIINVSPNKITKAQYDGSGKEYLIIEWDTAFYTYNLDGSGNGVWNYLRGSSPDSITTEYAYSDENFENLIYTATYDSSGNLISKIPETPSDQIQNYPSGLLMRKIQGATGNVYEYENDDSYYNNGSFGRPLLESSHTETVLGGVYATSNWYKSYEWGEQVVEISEYDGDYSTAIDDPVLSGLYTTEERVHYTYFHNGEYSTALAESNWHMAAKGIYNEFGGADENLIEGYMWYWGGGYTPTDDYLMKAYNQATGYGTEWEPVEDGHKVITSSVYTTETSLLDGTYTVTNYYQTYEWDAGQVRVDVYDGVYAITSDYTTRTGVVDSELRYSYIYDHNGETENLDTSTNNWDLIEKDIYNIYGDLVKIYRYDELGNLVENVNVSYESIVAPLSGLQPFPADVSYSGKLVWSESDGNDNEIFYYDGTEIIQLTNNSYADEEPAMSANGKIVWHMDDGNDDELFYYDGTSVIQLTDNSYDDRSYEINANGEVVWYMNDGTDDEIFYYDGTSVTQITNNTYSDKYPRINANGEMTWYALTGGNYEIFYYDGTSLIQITDNSYDDFCPEINANGEIVWRGHDSTDNEVFYYDGTSVIQLTDNSYNEGYYTHQIYDNGDVFWIGDDRLFCYDGQEVTELLYNEGMADQYLMNANGQIVCATYNGLFYYDGTEWIQLSDDYGYNPKINSSGEVVWQDSYYQIFYYDGVRVQQIADDAYTNQIPRIDEQGEISWYSDLGLIVWGGMEPNYDITTYYVLSGNLKTRVYPKPDDYGVMCYRYIDEDWEDTGQGRVDLQVLEVPDEESAIAYFNEYYTDTDLIQKKTLYTNADYSDPANPVFSGEIRSYTYTYELTPEGDVTATNVYDYISGDLLGRTEYGSTYYCTSIRNYDEDGSLDNKYRYVYDVNGNIIAVYYSDCMEDTALILTETAEFDQNGNRTSLSRYTAEGALAFMGNYIYDGNGNRISAEDRFNYFQYSRLNNVYPEENYEIPGAPALDLLTCWGPDTGYCLRDAGGELLLYREADSDLQVYDKNGELVLDNGHAIVNYTLLTEIHHYWPGSWYSYFAMTEYEYDENERYSRIYSYYGEEDETPWDADYISDLIYGYDQNGDTAYVIGEIRTDDPRYMNIYTVDDYDAEGKIITRDIYETRYSQDDVLPIQSCLYEYTPEGRLDAIKTYDDGQNLVPISVYGYDLDGNLTSECCYDRLGGLFSERVNIYDGSGYLISATYTSSDYRTYSGISPDDPKTYPYFEEYTYEYDAGSNMTRKTLSEVQEEYNGGIIAYSYTLDKIWNYDLTGNVISSEYTSVNNNYDAQGILISSDTYYRDSDYEYNGNGDLLAKYVYDENDELTYVLTNEYDSNGNLIGEYADWSGDGTINDSKKYGYSNIAVEYTYYSSGNIHTKETPDGGFFEYTDENWMGRGYGRVILKRDSVNSSFERTISWNATTGDVEKAEVYADADETVHLEAVWYYASGRVQKRIPVSTSFDAFYEYLDEDWQGTGRGRLYRMVDGNDYAGHVYEYHPGTDIVSKETVYVESGFYSNPDDPVFSDIVAVYEYDIDGRLETTETYEGSTGAWLETCWFYNNDDNRLYQKHDYDGTSYQYADYGQGIDDVDGYFLEIKWEPLGNQIYGYSGAYSTTPLLEWEQYSGTYTTGLTLATYEYYVLPDEDQYNWKNIYAWDGDWEYMLSYEYSTDGSYMGEYTTGHTPGEVFDLPEHDPAKPEHEMSDVEYYQGTGNIRTYYDSYSDMIYTFEDSDFYGLTYPIVGQDRGQGRLIGVEWSNGDYYSFTYHEDTLSIKDRAYVWHDAYAKTEECTKQYFYEDFYNMPNIGGYIDDIHAVGASIFDGDGIRPYVALFDSGDPEPWWMVPIGDYSGINLVAVDYAEIAGYLYVVAATTEWDNDAEAMGLRLSVLDENDGSEIDTVLFADDGEIPQNLSINDVLINPDTGEIFVVGNYGEYPNYDVCLAVFSFDGEYLNCEGYGLIEDMGGNEQGFELTVDESGNLVVHGSVELTEGDNEPYCWVYENYGYGDLVYEGYDPYARSYDSWWMGIASSGRLFLEEELYDGVEEYREVIGYVEDTYMERGTGVFAQEYCTIEEMADHGMAQIYYYYNDGIYSTETNARIIFDDGLVCELMFQGEDDVIPTKVIEPTGDTAWFLWGALYNGDYTNVAIEHTYDGEWKAYTLSDDIEGPTDLFNKAYWIPTAWDGDYSTALLPELGGWPSGITVEYPELPQQFYADSGRVKTSSDYNFTYYYLDEDFYDPEDEYDYVPEYHEGRVERVLMERLDYEYGYDGLFLYGYFDDSTDRIEHEYQLIYDQTSGDELNFTYTGFYNEYFYEGSPSVYSDVSVRDGYGRMYTAMHGRQMTEEYVKRYAYVAGEDQVLIEYTTEYEEMEPGIAYYYWDEGFSDIEYVRFEFDSGAIGEGIVDYYEYENGWDLEVIPTKGDFTAVDPEEYPEYENQAGKVYWFFWEGYDVSGDMEPEPYIVLEYDNVSTWNAYTFNDSDPLDWMQWTPRGNPTPTPDPLTLDADINPYGDWWQWVADNQLGVEFPPLSTEFFDGGDGIIDEQVDYNDMFNTIYVYTWDDTLGAEQMTMDIYLDTDRNGSYADPEDAYIYQGVYSTLGDTDLENMDSWYLVDEGYYYTLPSALYASDPIPSLNVETGDEMQEFMNWVTEMELLYSSAGVTAALLDIGIENGGHAADTAEVMTSVASGVNLLSLDVFGSLLQATPNLVSGAIRYAADMGAKIIAMPFTMALVPDVVKDAIGYATEKGSILIAAAGNTGSEIDDKSLAAQEGVISVGSVDNDGELSAWSNYGDEVDLYAPWDIIENEEGTSFSAAFVAGVTALILEENPEMTTSEVLAYLKTLTADLRKEDKEDIKGVDIEELLSKQKAIEQNQSEFSGYPIKGDVVINVNENQ